MRSIPQGDFSLQLITPPAREPWTLNQAKDHLRIERDFTDEDDQIELYMLAAREYVEGAFNLCLLEQLWEMSLPNFPYEDTIRFPLWPVREVTYFRYTDLSDVTNIMSVGGLASGATLRTRLSRKPAEIILAFGQSWPGTVLQTGDGIRIGLSCGYVRGDSPETLPIPNKVLQAMRLLLSHMYENRAVVTLGTLDTTTPLAIGLMHLIGNDRLY